MMLRSEGRPFFVFVVFARILRVLCVKILLVVEASGRMCLEAAFQCTRKYLLRKMNEDVALCFCCFFSLFGVYG